MARDTQEELERLTAELLAEETPEPEEAPLQEPESWEEWLDFDDLEEEEPVDMDATQIYRNIPADYAEDYTDYGQEDWEAPVEKPQSYRGLLVTLGVLTMGIVGVVIYWMVRFF